MYTAAGRYGFLGMAIPEAYGGGGSHDFRFNQIIAEELARAGIGGAGLGITLHNDVLTPYFVEYCTDEQRQRWLPGIASGELITAIAMTEPGTGSDLAGVATTAVRDGDEYVVNGSKTFITNGINADLVIVVAKTDPTQRHTGMSLLVVERGMAGFERGRNLDKIGLHSQDTAELFFTDVRVPVANRLGEEGQGFKYLAHNLAQERLSIAITGVATAKAAVDWTIEYVKGRPAFGTTINAFQNTKFVLAEVQTEVDVAQAYVDQCVAAAQHAAPVAGRRGEGQVLRYRSAAARRRPVPAVVRGLRLHDRVPDRTGLRRLPRHLDLRRHQRDHEDDHRQVDGPEEPMSRTRRR